MYEKGGKLPCCEKWRTYSAPLVRTWRDRSDLWKGYSSSSDFVFFCYDRKCTPHSTLGLSPFTFAHRMLAISLLLRLPF